ncbi:hypothetical protein EON77_02110 [bacterium]|nr:MAG: hypothetical protein EON77_02110 [bacterium]
MGMLSRIVACLLALALPCAAQTTQTVDLDHSLQVDLPADWRRGDARLAGQAFNTYVSRGVVDAIHPVGSRMTDLPYGVVDVTTRYAGVPTPAMQDDYAATLAEGYGSAINPPSKSDRPPSWKRSKVSSVRHDYTNRRFEFDATVTYDFVGDLHVRVVGVFNAKDFAVLTLWSDDAYDKARGGELDAIRRSFRFALAATPPPSMKEAFLSKTRWLMGFVIAAVVGLQVWVLVRERRERRAAGVG